MLNKSLRQARNINGIVGKILEFHQHDLGNNCACVLVEDLNDKRIFMDFLELDNMNVIWESVLRLASFMGYIRWYNEKNDCGISFGGLFSNDGINISQNDHQTIIDKLNFRAKTKITEDIISVFIDNNKTDDVFNLCNGHDVSTLLTLAVKTNEREFESALYASFHSYLFAQTKLFQNILEWQTIYGFNILMT